MKHFNKLTIGFAAIAILSTSCSTNNTNNTSSQTVETCYATVTDTETGETFLSQSVSTTFKLNWDTSKADFIINDLNLDGNTNTLTVTDIDWGIEGTKWYTSKIATVSGSFTPALGAVTLTNFSYKWNNYALVFNFTIDDRYVVTGSLDQFVFYGKYTVYTDGVDDYEGKATNFVAQVNLKTRELSIGMYNATFSANMPVSVNLQMSKIPFYFTNMGKTIVFEKEELIPSTIGDDIPQPKRPISDLKGTITPGAGMSLEFICTVGNTPYKVIANPTLFSENDEF